MQRVTNSMVECSAFNRGVQGSSPWWPTILLIVLCPVRLVDQDRRPSLSGREFNSPTGYQSARVTQMVRVPALQAGGSWFESKRAHHIRKEG